MHHDIAAGNGWRVVGEADGSVELDQDRILTRACGTTVEPFRSQSVPERVHTKGSMVTPFVVFTKADSLNDICLANAADTRFISVCPDFSYFSLTFTCHGCPRNPAEEDIFSKKSKRLCYVRHYIVAATIDVELRIATSTAVCSSKSGVAAITQGLG